MKLSEDLKKCKVDRPDEWTMARFIQKAEYMERVPNLELDCEVAVVCDFVRAYETRKYEILHEGGELLSVVVFMVDYCQRLRNIGITPRVSGTHENFN